MIVNMLLRRCSTIIVLVTGIAYACDCGQPSVEAKEEHADVIFRGTIITLRDAKGKTDLPAGWVRDTKRVAIFRVSRVWKGDVGETFEMPAVEETATCNGFWPPYLKVGLDLLVYARRIGSAYYTGICGSHKLAKDRKGSGSDFEELGPGVEPRKKKDQSSK
jgi:hypothetical protein